ncbi:MAG: hypothetical protein ACRDPW_05935 [Mycobacteriales bacterium]
MIVEPADQGPDNRRAKAALYLRPIPQQRPQIKSEKVIDNAIDPAARTLRVLRDGELSFNKAQLNQPVGSTTPRCVDPTAAA